MEFKVLSVLKKYMSEEEFKAFEKAAEFEDAISNDISKYIKSNTPKVEDLEVKAQEEVIKSLGLENVTNIDDLKKHIEVVNDTTTDKDKEILKWKKDYEDISSKYETLTTEQKETKQLELIKGLGVTDEKQINFLKWDFNNQVNDEKDFATVVEEYRKANDITTDTKFIKDEFGQGNSKDLDIGAAWKAQRSLTRK
jgi:ferritin